MIGRHFPPYTVLEEISRGGMGIVYKAVDTRLGREVAIKVLPDDLVHDPARRERLLQEARAASVLEHPHIAVIHGVDEVDGVSFIVMELIRGEPLTASLARGPLAPKRALDLAIEAAEGLSRAHEKNIIHRDFKPANVMVTDDGHAKIIDFGLAKVAQPVAADSDTVTTHKPATDPGVVMGTVQYMSPEQARGGRVDHRSDIFSFGVTLYEMLTGRAPFHGGSSLDTMHAILTQPLPAVAATPQLSIEVASEAQRVLEKCVAKDPDDRYQGMRDVVVDLRAVRRRLESTSGASVVGAAAARTPARRRPLLTIGAVAVAVAALAGLGWWWTGQPAAPVSPSGKPSVAVLYFENNTGDPSLDWMRTGVTDMLVTDLSQAREFEVIGTDRLYQILQELRRADDRVISADLVDQIAQRAGVTSVLLGSYVKAGSTIRLNARLQEARTGRIVSSERVDGDGEASLFTMVDELTRRLRSAMAQSARGPLALIKGASAADPGEELDRGLKDVTTRSIEAYREYARGIELHQRGLYPEALPFFERAVALDPEFAMAIAKLAVVHGNMVNYTERDTYAERAIKLVDRLTTRERFYIEGYYYSLRPETLLRGMEAYRKAIELHPEHLSARHNLALKYAQLDQFPQAIEQYEELIRRGASSASTHTNLASSYVQHGDITRALQVAERFAREHPDSGAGARSHAATLIAAGRLDEAKQQIARAESLTPGVFQTRLLAATVALLQDDYTAVEQSISAMTTGKDAFQRYLGVATDADYRFGRGRGRDALATFERALALPGATGEERSAVPARQAQVELVRGNSPAAIRYAETAVAAGTGIDVLFYALHTLAVAQAAAGRASDADATLARLDVAARALPGERAARRSILAQADVAMVRKDATRAVALYTQALATMPPHGPPAGPATAHSEAWFGAAMAHAAAGQDDKAEELFLRLQESYERTFNLELYARSFYLLGQLYERRGDRAKTVEQYARFIKLWGDGDLARDWVAAARARLASLNGAGRD